MSDRIEALGELGVYVIMMICGTVLVALHHSEFTAPLIAVFMTAGVRGVRGAFSTAKAQPDDAEAKAPPK